MKKRLDKYVHLWYDVRTYKEADMRTSLTDLRANLYNKIDHLIETGEPIEIERKGHIVKVISIKPYSKLKRIIKREDVISDLSDELIKNNWLSEWKGNNDLS